MTEQQGHIDPPSRWRPILTRAVKVLLAVLVVYFAGAQLVRNWGEVKTYPWTINIPLLLLSIAVYLLTFTLFSKTWCWLMEGFGYVVKLRHGFKIAYISTLGRYIPGRIWPIFGMLYVARQVNITEEAAVASWGLSMLFSIPPAFAVGLISTLFEPSLISGPFGAYLGGGLYITVTVFCSMSLVFILFPHKVLRIINWMLRIIRRPPIQFKMTMRITGLVHGGYFVAWTLYGLAFWIFLMSITTTAVPVISGIGSFVIAYQVGYLAVFTPGGLGARELIIIAVLTPYFGPAAAGVALAARIWSTVGDIIASLIALRLKV